MREAQGFLLLKLAYHKPSDNFDVYMHEDKLCSIIEGVYISPYAQSILKDNAELIDGLMLDTTWEVMDKYVTSILVAASCNTSVPLGFSFGAAETKGLYELLFDFFKKKLDIDLAFYIVECN